MVRSARFSAPALRRSAAVRRLCRFGREEDGLVTPMVLIFLFLMMVTGGIAVDLMRFEWRRVQVQNTLDRATLAAANLTQSIAVAGNFATPEAVAAAQEDKVREIIQDYFTKAGLTENLEHVELSSGFNFRIVEASATVVSPNFFMKLLAVPDLRASNVSRAEQRTTNVEIALVLDISASMFTDTNRITNLKRAAGEFVDAVLTTGNRDLISITLVPYNGQVNLGPDLFSQFTVSQRHNYPESYCIDLPLNTYSSTSISRSLAMPQAPFGDPYAVTSVGKTFNHADPLGPYINPSRNLYAAMWCTPYEENYVKLHSSDPVALKRQINAMIPIGGTSINVGMKWGTALLDPSAQSIVTSFINLPAGHSNKINSAFAGRPAAFNDTETSKIIILMTDGSNFEAQRYNDTDYRAGASPVYRSNSGEKYSIFHASRLSSSSSTERCTPFWVSHYGSSTTKGQWHSRPWNGTVPSTSSCYSGTTNLNNYTPPSGVSRLTWQDVWRYTNTEWVAWHLYARALRGVANTTAAQNNRTSTFNTWMSTFVSKTSVATMNSETSSICSLAKRSGIQIYSIAFEAPDEGQNLLRECASLPTARHYFYVNADNQGLDISSAFRTIASNLSKLRLTQ